MNGASSGVGGPAATGSWSNTNNNWNTASDGSSATPGIWTASDTAVFAAGTDATGAYTVTIINQETAAGLTLEEGSVSIGAGSSTGVTLQGMGTLSVAANATMNINSTLVGTDSNADGFVKSGDGTLIFSQNELIEGERDINGGVLKISNQLNISEHSFNPNNRRRHTSSERRHSDSNEFGKWRIVHQPGNLPGYWSEQRNGQLLHQRSRCHHDLWNRHFRCEYHRDPRARAPLYKTGTGEFRVEGAGMQNNTFPKLVVLGGLYRIGSAHRRQL